MLLATLIDFPARPAPRFGPALAPALPAFGPVPPELDRALSALGCRAAAGDTDALNALYAAYAPRLIGWVRRAQASLLRYGVDRALEPEDIAQQAYVVFADLVQHWEDDRELSRYLLAYFPWRLSDAVRKLSDPRRSYPLADLPEHVLEDGTAAAAESVALLEAMAAGLPEREGRVLLLRVRDGHGWETIANRLGVNRRTVLRDWKRLRDLLRASLAPGAG